MSPSPETPVAEPGTTIACRVIRTGRGDCHAHFYPALYQLTLLKDGLEEKIDLGYSGSRLLERLLQEPGEVVSREELMNHAWADRVVGQGSLNQQIYTLRQVLGDEKSREIIQTLPRRGYLFNPGYLVCPPSCEEPAEVDAALTADASGQAFLRRHGRRRGSWLALLGTLAVVAVGLFASLYLLSLPGHLHSSELSLGRVNLLYIDQDPQRLQQLIMQTHGLASRLEGLSGAPAELMLTNSGGFFELLCVQPGGGARSLMFHETQLGQLADAQLRRCLP